MSVNDRPAIRFHRVTTRRRSLRALQCPLEPELLVAEFAGELPPDVALAVREHIAVCEICGARSRALQAPYELLASLAMSQSTMCRTCAIWCVFVSVHNTSSAAYLRR